MPFDKKFKRELEKFFEELPIKLAEKDILDPEMSVDAVLSRNFKCPSPEIREKIRAAIEDWRNKGKVDWEQIIF